MEKTRSTLAIYFAVVAFFALISCQSVGAEEANKQKLRESMKERLLKLAKENGENLTPEQATTIINPQLDTITDESYKGFTDEQVTAIADNWIKTVRENVQKKKEEDAKKQPAEKKEEVKQPKKKRLTPPRWIWDKKDWPAIARIEKEIQEEQGYTYKTNYDAEEKTEFADRTFYFYRTEDYIVASDVNARFTAEVAVYMSKFVKMFPKIFPMPPRGNINSKLLVVVFYDRKQYKKMLPGAIGGWSRGVFTPRMFKKGWPEFTVYSYFYDGGTTDYDADPYYYEDGVRVERPKSTENKDAKGPTSEYESPPNFSNFPYAVLQHEATHAMLRTYTGLNTYVQDKSTKQWVDRFPIFLNEACATYFQNFDLYLDEKENRKRTAILCNDRWLVAKRLKETQDKPFDLSFYLSLINGGGKVGTWAPDDGGIETAMNYALAQSYAHYMLAESSGRKKFKKMMTNLYKGRPELADEKDVKKMDKGWNKHIREVILTAADEEGGVASIHDLKVEE